MNCQHRYKFKSVIKLNFLRYALIYECENCSKQEMEIKMIKPIIVKKHLPTLPKSKSLTKTRNVA